MSLAVSGTEGEKLVGELEGSRRREREEREGRVEDRKAAEWLHRVLEDRCQK